MEEAKRKRPDPSLLVPKAALEVGITNVVGTHRLLEHCRQFGTPHFVLASSPSVYSPDTPLPAEESAIPDPCSPYAPTKLHGEQWGALDSMLHGLRFLALRFLSVWDYCERAIMSAARPCPGGLPTADHRA